MIDPAFRNINRLVAISLKNSEDDPSMIYFFKCYISLIEVKSLKVLIDNKPFFDQPIKEKQEAY